MAKLKTDSPLSLRIVRAFLEFLDSVEPAPGVDLEGLEVARECLADVFKLDPDSLNDYGKPDVLIDIFRSLEASERQKIKSDKSQGGTSVDGPSSSSAHNLNNANSPETSRSMEETWTTEPQSIGCSKDELFGQFFAALEKVHFFKTSADGKDDPVQLDKATCVFHDALNEMESSGCQAYDQKALAETLKCQGNRAMQSKLYSDALELYSIAVSLCEDNAVYYCNRAAAYTQINKYNEAIRDCLKSIEIDPNYSKAFSRLGLAYFAQGNYTDAIEKGFKKALQLDPNNEFVKENIRMAEQKLKEETEGREQNQNASSGHSNQGSSNQSTEGSRRPGLFPFTMPFDTGALPSNLASMFMNMAASANQGQSPQNRQREDGAADGSEEPGIRVGGNIDFDFGENMPEQLRGTLQSVVMEFMNGISPQGNPQDSTNRRSAN